MTDRPDGGRLAVLAPWLVWIAGLAAAFHPALTSGFRRLQISVGDPRLVDYILEHTWLWLLRRPGHEAFWSPPVFHPAGSVGAYSDTMLGSAPLYWIWRALGAGPGLALELWMIACLSLAYLATYAFLRRCLRLTAWPSAAGAFLFGFGIARLANFNSPQLLPVFWTVLAFHALFRLLEEAPERQRRGRWALVFFGALALQTWSAFYPAFFLVLALGAALVVALAQRDARARVVGTLRGHAVAIGAGAALALLAVAPMVLEHLAVAKELGWRPWESTLRGLPVPRTWLFSGTRSLAYGALNASAFFTFDSPSSQHVASVGFVTTLTMLAGLWVARSRPLARVMLATIVVLVLVTTRWPGDVTAWRWLHEVLPGARAVRYLARIGILLAFPAAVGVALALQGLARGGHRWLAVALALLCGGEQLQRLSSWDEARYREAVASVAAEVDPDAGAFFLMVAPPPRPPATRKPLRLTHVFAMWVGAEAGVPTVNGFYGNLPPGWGLVDADPATPGAAARLRQGLDRWLRERGVARDDVQVLEISAERLPWSGRRSQRSSPPR